jgi:toluene monooxygenase system ferredoxin subunit
MWKRVCRADEVPANGLKQFSVSEGLAIVIARAGEEYFAHQAFCPHTEVPLAEGVHDGAVLTCLEHMWQFDLRTGAAMGDAEAPLKAYPLKNESGELYVWVGPGSAS